MSLVAVSEQDPHIHIHTPSEATSPTSLDHRSHHSENGHETTPLLARPPTKRTPLPMLQLLAVYFVQFCEPITVVVIFPFAPELVRRTGVTGGDEKKTGYYTGIIESVFMIAEVLTVYSWASLSDKYGRRPILLVAPLGLALSMLGFGLSSKSYIFLVLFRCFQGMFNGNIGVSKSVIAELTDASNIGDAIALTPLMWSTGEILGPAIGGLLSNPADKWPNLFEGTRFWKDYPYFLPCAVTGCIALFAFFFALLVLRETSPIILARQNAAEPITETPSSTNATYGSLCSSSSSREAACFEPPTEDFNQKAPSMFELLSIRQIQLTLAANALYYFCDASYVALIPLMYSTSIKEGGLGFSPHQIGLIMIIQAFWAAFVNGLLLPRLLRRWGYRNVFIFSLSCLTVATGMFTIVSSAATQAGRVDLKVIILIIIQCGFGQMLYIAYACIQVLVVESAPSNAALAATNGLAQMVSVGCRALGPWVATSLFSLSLEKHLLQGRLVYLVIVFVDLICIYIGFFLPKKLLRLESEL